MTVMMGTCSRGHEAPLGKMCLKCVRIRYREADEAEVRVAELEFENAILRRALQHIASIDPLQATRSDHVHTARLALREVSDERP